MAKLTEAQKEKRKENSREYYHAHKNEINAKRKKERLDAKKKKQKRKSQIKKARIKRKRRKTGNGRSKRKFGIKIYCPIHKQQLLYKLIYNTTVKTKPSKSNRRGLVGTRGQTDWLYCPKCDKPRKIQFTVTE